MSLVAISEGNRGQGRDWSGGPRHRTGGVHPGVMKVIVRYTGSTSELLRVVKNGTQSQP